MRTLYDVEVRWVAVLIVTAGCGRIGLDTAVRSADGGASADAPATGANAPYARVILEDHPIGYWRLGELVEPTARDISGNSLDGTYQGGVTLGEPGAIVDDSDTAISLDGSTGMVRIPSTPAIEAIANSVISVDAWVRGGLPGSQEVFSSWDGDGRGFQLIYNGGVAGAWSGDGIVHSSTEITDDAWHYLAVVWTGTQGLVYVDGELTGSGASKFSPSGNENQIGTQCDEPDSTSCSLYRPGEIDEVAVYPVALSEARVLAHYQAGHGS
jgi:hypothetical protein